jgi:hypothetical protein
VTRLISRNLRYLIRQEVDEDSLWHIEDRTTGKVVTTRVDGQDAPLGFIESAEAEDWIAEHEQPGWGSRKEKP